MGAWSDMTCLCQRVAVRTHTVYVLIYVRTCKSELDLKLRVRAKHGRETETDRMEKLKEQDGLRAPTIDVASRWRRDGGIVIYVLC